MSSKTFSLIVSMPGQNPARHDLSSDSVSLGRGPDNDIQVLVSEVSVKHAIFAVSDESVAVSDVGSTNGTKLNGAPVDEGGKELSPMDKLLLGETIPAYFVPSAVLDSTPAEELIASIESSQKQKTEPVPVAAAAAPAATPVQPVQPAAPGGLKPGGVAPAPVKPAAVAAPAPAASGATTVKLSKVKPNDGPVKPGGVPAPAAPGAPATPVPKPAGAAPTPVPAPAAPGGVKPPVAPVPLKGPGEGGAAPVPVPAPKAPPKP